MADVEFELSSVELLKPQFLLHFPDAFFNGKGCFGSGRTVIAYNKRVFISLLMIVSVSISLLKTFKILQ